MTTPSLWDRLAGGVWGHLVGDAMGVPYEFRSPGQVGEVRWGEQGTHHQPPGTWSDDGALMLALLDSLLERGFDVEDQGQRAVRWKREGAYTPGGVFDIGGTTSAALERIAHGTPAADAGGAGENDNGNGSLMRVLPVTLVCRDEAYPTLVQQASDASAVTHAHPRSRLTCAVYTMIGHGLLTGMVDRRAAIGEAFETVRSELTETDMADFEILENHAQRKGSGYVVDCFWSACDAFLAADSYGETVERAIRYGNDTDTTACVAGGLAGIYWGVAAIPTEWRNGMRGKEIVEPMVARLVAAAG